MILHTFAGSGGLVQAQLLAIAVVKLLCFCIRLVILDETDIAIPKLRWHGVRVTVPLSR